MHTQAHTLTPCRSGKRSPSAHPLWAVRRLTGRDEPLGRGRGTGGQPAPSSLCLLSEAGFRGVSQGVGATPWGQAAAMQPWVSPGGDSARLRPPGSTSSSSACRDSVFWAFKNV